MTCWQEVISALAPKLLDANFDTQQTILRLLVERIVVHGQNLEIHLALPVSSHSHLTPKDPSLRLKPQPPLPFPFVRSGRTLREGRV